jgi:hypothetical protein
MPKIKQTIKKLSYKDLVFLMVVAGQTLLKNLRHEFHELSQM